MAYASRQLKPRGPSKEDKKQLKGNLKHHLKEFDVEEIIHCLSGLERKRLRSKKFDNIEERFLYLKRLKLLYESDLKTVNSELDRTKKYLPEDFDLPDNEAEHTKGVLFG